MKLILSTLCIVFCLVGGSAVRPTFDQVRSLIAERNYFSASATIVQIRRTLASTARVPTDFAAIKRAGAFDQNLTVSPEAILQLLAEAQAKVDAHDISGAVKALDLAQVLAAKLDQSRPAAERYTAALAQVAKEDAGRPGGATAPTLRRASWLAYQTMDYANAVILANQALKATPDIDSFGIHLARTLQGLGYLGQGRKEDAVHAMLNSLQVETSRGFERGPTMVLAKELFKEYPKEVIQYLDLASSVTSWKNRGVVLNWKQTWQSGVVPDFGAHQLTAF